MSDLTPQELHKADLIYEISKKRQVYDRDGNLVLNYSNDILMNKYPYLGFLCYNRLNEKYSVLYNNGCMGILKEFHSILETIIKADDEGKLNKIKKIMKKEPHSFIVQWYLGELIPNVYNDDVNQDKMYDYIREYRRIKTKQDKAKKPKKTDDGITIREKCEKAGVPYRRVLIYRNAHPTLTEDEVIEIYRKKADLQNG